MGASSFVIRGSGFVIPWWVIGGSLLIGNSMTNRVSCQNCGAKVPLPDGFAKARIRCPGCGYYADVPADARAALPPSPREGEGPGVRGEAGSNAATRFAAW